MRQDIFRDGIRGEKKPILTRIWNYLTAKRYCSLMTILVLVIIIFYLGKITVKENQQPILPECTEERCSAFIRDCPTCTGETITKTTTVFNYVCFDGRIVSDEDECGTRDAVKYVCPNGIIVEDKASCESATIEITSDNANTDNDVTLSIDDVEYEIKGDDWATITKIDFTIMNQGDKRIFPKVFVRTYFDNDTIQKKTFTREEIVVEDVLGKNEWIKQSAEMHLSLKLGQTLNIMARDYLHTPSKILVTTSMNITE